MLLSRFMNAAMGVRSATSYVLNPTVGAVRFSSNNAKPVEKDGVLASNLLNGIGPGTPSESSSGAPVPSAKPISFAERMVNSLPLSIQPYARLMRLEKPAGTWLLFIPGSWAITMAAYATSAPISQTLWMLTLFGVGSVIMRGAGCTINDMCDRDLDSQVERTVGRPLASGKVSMTQASTFLASQMAVGFGVLYALPTDCYLLACASLPLVFSYPLFKRFTYYPQAVLSACFTWGALLGFPAMGVWDWPVMGALYSSCYLWCMTYDTIYAHQDKKFDVLAGIKSTALAWGENTKPVITALSVGQVGLLTTAGVLAGMGPGYFGAVGYASYRLAQMIYKVDLDNPDDCWMWFNNNITTGHYIWAGTTVDYILRLSGFI